MSLATVEDVAARLGRETSSDENELAATLLGDAELMLRARIPDLLERAAKDPAFADLVVMVEANMVVRVLRNPDGYRQESEGGYSYTVDTRAAAGFLTVLDDEWKLLGYRDGAFTITPHLDGDRWPWWTKPPWAFQYDATPGEPHTPPGWWHG
ncbi:Gp19/Gp15/Gp42 family protein [Sciscionella sediminilitoris]|uniref:Gp19/Gp15/Gp42 family protein n=1 Tax=Sciscionella sediminilitoris TaxID=1445613 RepID=UPI0009E9A84D|nr:Gp19/Gp15/Gp42 family protein [Sciscionella sp. SE31]